MKLYRVVLVCSLLLLAVTPSYALPCKACTGDTYPYCEPAAPGQKTRCNIGLDTCNTVSAPSCTGLVQQASPAMLAEWSVASIEISRPADGSKVVTTPAAIAEAAVSLSSLK